MRIGNMTNASLVLGQFCVRRLISCLVIEGLEKAAADLPFAMLGVDSDNDSAFMNQSVFDYCKGRGLEQTRSRAYKKNDQAWVEQKNGSVVRRLVGYGLAEEGSRTSH
jgi:hypothetical protein